MWNFTIDLNQHSASQTVGPQLDRSAEMQLITGQLGLLQWWVIALLRQALQ